MIEARQEAQGSNLGHGLGECPATKLKKDDTYKRIMLVAAGSAMAAGCEPCLNMVIPNLIEVGVSDQEIRGALEIGQYLRDRKVEIMKEAADILAGTSFLDKQVPEECTADEMEFVKADKIRMLIAVGAAAAGNCESCLEAVLPELKKAGASREEILGAIDIGLTVKEKPASVTKASIDKLIGDHDASKTGSGGPRPT